MNILHPYEVRQHNTARTPINPKLGKAPISSEAFIRRHAYLIPQVLNRTQPWIKRHLNHNMPTLYLALIDELALRSGSYRDAQDPQVLSICLIFHLQHRLICEMRKTK